jgi:predicted RNase H-like nuclease (RuvC/YqgF family)
MTQKKIISIKKVLKNSLGKVKAERYLKGIEIIFNNAAAANAMDIYQYALAQLVEGETERALNCVVFGLDLDREHRLTLHLCKTMLYSLTQFFADNNIEKYKAKYSGNFEGTTSKLKKKIKELEKIVKNEEGGLEKLQKSMMKHNMNPIVRFFKKGKLNRQVQELKTTISNYNSELDQIKSELNIIEEMIQKEEYIKVVGLIIEVCIFPNRFDSDLTKTSYM